MDHLRCGTDLSQHLKKALAIFPSVFIQIFLVELSGLFMVTLKNTKQEIKIRFKVNMTDEILNVTKLQVFNFLFKLTLIHFYHILAAFHILGNPIYRL